MVVLCDRLSREAGEALRRQLVMGVGRLSHHFLRFWRYGYNRNILFRQRSFTSSRTSTN